MVDFHGSQCGFCTPGFVMSLYALWMKSPEPSDAADREGAAGQSLPLHRLRGDRARGAGDLELRQGREGPAGGRAQGDRREACGAAATARASRSARASSGWSCRPIVDDLAAVLEAEPTATIVAGATDVGLWVTKFMRDISPAIFIGGLDELQDDRGGRRRHPHRRRRHLHRGVRDACRSASRRSGRCSTASAASRCATWARSAATSPTARRSATRRRR